MPELPHDKKSYWLASTQESGYPKLINDMSVDVAIVGAGIMGLTVAYLLKKSGLSVAVIEKDSIAAGVTGHTTGKITSQHNLIYAKLHKRLGEKTARLYGEANQSALALIERIITDEGIECEFRHEDNYVYTTQDSQIPIFQNEAKIAHKLGLPATFETDSVLPFPISAAVRFSNQATFHVRKYLLGLARIVDGQGSYVYEHSHVIGIRDGKPGHIKTGDAKVKANSIIVATNVPTFPLIARGTYCIAEYPMQSYIVAGKTNYDISGMYISPDSQHYSILPVVNGQDNLLLIGGEGHVPGARWNPHERYERLAAYAQKHFGIEHIEYRWSHRDYLGYDDMPLIGKVYPWSKNLYTATGFMKWGLTNGTMAAQVLHDQITGLNNQYASVFDPHRLSAPASIPKVIREKLPFS